MADKTDRNSPQSSSPSLPSDPLLERLLGGIERGLDGLVQGSQRLAKGQEEVGDQISALHRAFAELHKFVAQSNLRQENRVADLQTAIDVFVESIKAVVEHQKTLAGTTVDARRSLDESKRAFDQAVKEVTGSHALMREGDAPPAVRRAAVALTNWIWPKAVRGGRAAMLYGFKLVFGSVSLGAIGKLIHMLLSVPW